MTEWCWAFAAAVPRTPGSMGVDSFALGWRWPPADHFVILLHPRLQNVVFIRRMTEAGGSFVQTFMSSLRICVQKL